MNYFIMLCLFIYATDVSDAALKDERDSILREEVLKNFGCKIDLSYKEELVNMCLMNYKHQELDNAMKNPNDSKFLYHYSSCRDSVRNSKVYNIIKDMPKGAVLHIHDMAILGPDYLLKLTYLNYLYMCNESEVIKFKFSDNIPHNTCREWQLVSDARECAENLAEFNENLRKEFTLVNCDLSTKYPNVNHVWDAFMSYFYKVESLITYRPVWEQYLYDSLKAFREENIMYVEIRTILPFLYDLDGTLLEPIVAAQSYQKVINMFLKDYPDFIGVKIIYAPLRQIERGTLDAHLAQAREVKSKLPDLFAGFDLFGFEDVGGYLVDNLEKLAAVEDLDFFFHAGETNWLGSVEDENLADAIILNSKRIGHAINLVKHPLLMEEVIQKNIAIEVMVISNAVFYLVKDVRNHPLSILLSAGVPVVLSSDAPGAWEADVISHDYYVAFVGATNRHSDLRLLKALALNSLTYSAMNETEKDKAINIFKRRWDKFINEFDCSKYNPGIVALLCRQNEKKNGYCVQFTEAVGQLMAKHDNSAVQIINALSQRRLFH